MDPQRKIKSSQKWKREENPNHGTQNSVQTRWKCRSSLRAPQSERASLPVPWIYLQILATLFGHYAQGVIIPPKWANVALNPCAEQSWQLLYWPNNQKCYRIFTKGPCDETQEFYFDEDLDLPNCRCARGNLWYPPTRKCYKEYSKGPCEHGEYIEKSSIRQRGQDYIGACEPYQQCSPGLLFWPPTKKCYPLLSKGPCLHGHLLYINPETGVMDCGCDKSIMNTNYWLYEESCHELYTRGPCIQGHIFIYNLTRGETECICEPYLKTNYHQDTGRCYELNTPGPCRPGQIFVLDIQRMEAICTCLPGFVEWMQTGHCYREYTQGPCPQNNFLHIDHILGEGVCSRKMCQKGQLYDPVTDRCYSVGRKGPCPYGKIWVFERATSVRGKCYCDPQLVGYWEPHNTCYELGERGPCRKNKVLSYNKLTKKLACKCDYRRGYVAWTNGGCLKRGLTRKTIIPVIGPLEDAILGNSILSRRIHRGLTLPLREGFRNSTLNKSYSIQERILNDIRHNIKNKTCQGEDDDCDEKTFGKRIGRKLEHIHNSNKAKKLESIKKNEQFEVPQLSMESELEDPLKTGLIPKFEALRITSQVSKSTTRVSTTSSRGRNLNSFPRISNRNNHNVQSASSPKKKKEQTSHATPSRGQSISISNNDFVKKNIEISSDFALDTGLNRMRIPQENIEQIRNQNVQSPIFHKQTPNPPFQTAGNGRLAENLEDGRVSTRKEPKDPVEKNTKDLLEEILQRRLMKIRRKSQARSVQREELKRRRQHRQNLHFRKTNKKRQQFLRS